MSALRDALAERAAVERDLRQRLDAARQALTASQIDGARLASDIAALDRDAERLTNERQAVAAALDARRRELALPIPERDHALEAAVADADRALATALDELSGLRAARDAHGELLRAAQRAEAGRRADVDATRRRALDAADRASRERAEAVAAGARADELAVDLKVARAELQAAVAAETGAAERGSHCGRPLDAADGLARASSEKAADLGGAGRDPGRPCRGPLRHAAARTNRVGSRSARGVPADVASTTGSPSTRTCGPPSRPCWAMPRTDTSSRPMRSKRWRRSAVSRPRSGGPVAAGCQPRSGASRSSSPRSRSWAAAAFRTRCAWIPTGS